MSYPADLKYKVLRNVKAVDNGFVLDGEPHLCWIWQGEKDKDGYGIIKAGGGYRMAHRVLIPGFAKLSWATTHLCEQHACVRPEHITLIPRTKQAVSRARVWKRDEGICHLCGKPADPENWHLDHVVPLAQGGYHTYDNVRVSHPLCNMSAGPKLAPAKLSKPAL